MTSSDDNQVTILKCWQCRSELPDEPLPLSRQATCQACFEPLRCCYLCLHYDVSATHRCGEDRADPPLEKGVANFCEFFDPVLSLSGSGDQQDGRIVAAKSTLDALFDGTDASDDRSDAKEMSQAEQQLKDLFPDD